MSLVTLESWKSQLVAAGHNNLSLR